MITKIVFLGVDPVDRELVSVRATERLAGADLVLHDPASLGVVRALARPSAVLRVCRAGGLPVEECVAHAAAGKHVVRVVAGAPLVDGLASEAGRVMRAGGAIEIVSGVPGILAASDLVGTPLLDAEQGERLILRTTRDGALIPTGLNGPSTTCVSLDAVDLPRVASALIAEGHDPIGAAVVTPWPPRRHARSSRAPLGSMAGMSAESPPSAMSSLAGPCVLTVGVAAERAPLAWLETQPMFGLSVLITRATEQADATARAITARGAHPIELATIVLAPPDDPTALAEAVRRLSSYDVVALTSANGVDALFRSIERASLDARAFGHALVAVIGPGTEQAIARFGIRADVVADEHRGEALAIAIVEALRARRLPNGRVLLPRAAVARDALPNALRAAGVEVDVVAAYQSRPPDAAQVAEVRRVLAVGDVDIAMFTASSTVENLVAAVPDARHLLDRVTVATIGPITSESCRKHGIRVDVEASPYTVPALLDALDRYFSARPH